MRRSRLRLVLFVACVAVALSGCGGTGVAGGSSNGRLVVVAAENFWGSIATQLGGSKVAVQSIIVNPSTDPHSYEPTASDGIALAKSQMTIVNGIGYDVWASKLIAAGTRRARGRCSTSGICSGWWRAITRISGTRRLRCGG